MMMRSGIAEEPALAATRGCSAEDSTIDFYDQHAAEYFDRTATADLSSLYERFVRHLKPGAAVLDVGAGSGRDMKALKARGFRLLGIDASCKLAECASEFSGAICEPIRFDQIRFRNRFDGIWACASLLHVPKRSMPDVLHKLFVSLKRNGVLFVSLRHGDGESVSSDGRFFAYCRSGELRSFIENAGFWIDDLWTSADRLPSRESIEWINVIAHKISRRKVGHAIPGTKAVRSKPSARAVLL
jgi:SAM-dependent methyltransferase